MKQAQDTHFIRLWGGVIEIIFTKSLKESGMQIVNGAIFSLKRVESEMVENLSSWAKKIMFETWKCY